MSVLNISKHKSAHRFKPNYFYLMNNHHRIVYLYHRPLIANNSFCIINLQIIMISKKYKAMQCFRCMYVLYVCMHVFFWVMADSWKMSELVIKISKVVCHCLLFRTEGVWLAQGHAEGDTWFHDFLVSSPLPLPNWLQCFRFKGKKLLWGMGEQICSHDHLWGLAAFTWSFLPLLNGTVLHFYVEVEIYITSFFIT